MANDIPELHPNDANNRRLLSHVHPPDWENPEPNGRYNMVVVGGGTAGLVAAGIAGGLGAKTAIVERHLLGGDCLNYGCVPSKALLNAAHVAHTARQAHRFGIDVPTVTVDFAEVMDKVRGIRADIAPHDAASRLRDQAGVDVYLGQGEFVSDDALQVDGKTLRFGRAVIATGSRASPLSIPGLKEAGYLTNETVFSLTQQPDRLIVIGGGPIGCEMAQALARLGVEVSIINKSSRLLPRDNPRASEIIEEQFKSEDIRIHNDAEIVRVEGERGGVKRLMFKRQDTEHHVDAEEILVAVGRTPNLEGLGLQAAGVMHDEKGVHVDERLRTSNPRIFAAGDVSSRFKFTHAADALARIAVQNALFHTHKQQSALTIPWCTYTDPEVAHVGETAEACENAGLAHVHVDLQNNDRAITARQTRGFARAYYTGRKASIAGATVVAPAAGEMIGELVLAIQSGTGLSKLANVVHPYPTQAEILKHMGDAYMRTKMTPTVSSAMRRFFSWSR